MAKLRVPTVTTVIGEGGSGGALAIGVSDIVIMLENSVYSVITPEGCAAILWKDAGLADRAAAGLKLTAPDLRSNKLVDSVVSEPDGGGQTDLDETARRLDHAISAALNELKSLTPAELVRRRRQKMRAMGRWLE
jgi:acetyl-CoA carboxylase carboxyl transferase subunit alpha